MDGRCWCEIEITLARFNWTIIQNFFFSQREKARERVWFAESVGRFVSAKQKPPFFSCYSPVLSAPLKTA